MSVEMEKTKVLIEFESLLTKETDLCVLPRSAQGTITPAIRKLALANGLPLLEMSSSLGDFEVLPLTETEQSLKCKYIGWATSVSNNSSSLEGIRQINRKIASHLNKFPDIHEMEMPLLGTGAGRLRSIDVLQITIEDFAKYSRSDAVVRIKIADEKTYAQLKSWLSNTAVTSKDFSESFEFLDNLSNDYDERPSNSLNLPDNEQSYQKTFLLTWDPSRISSGSLREHIAEFEQIGSTVMNWSVGRKGIKQGDLVFMMRHGDDRPGLVGSGYVISDTWDGKHWDPKRPEWTASYADIQWSYLSELPLITLSELSKKFGQADLWTKNGSGHPIPDETADRLGRLWASRTRKKPDIKTPVQPPSDPRTYVSRFLADNPGSSVEDLLDIGKEVTAFAHLVATRNVSPPLSIGLFGEWGSGKTYFMDRVYQEINRLTGLQSLDKVFHMNIVQIRFNAWHYIETNLWASLVEAIFQDLDRWLRGQHKDVEKLFEQLTTSKQLRLEAVVDLIEARKRKQAVETELREAKRLHREAREAHLASPMRDVWNATAATFTVGLTEADRAQLKKAGVDLGLPQLEASATALVQTAKSCRDEGQRLRLLGNAFLHQFGSPLFVVTAVAVVLGIPLALETLRSWLSSNHSLFSNINAGVVGVASAISAVTAVIGTALGKGRRALNLFETFCTRLEQEIANATASRRQAVTKAEKELEEQAQRISEAERLLAIASDEAATAERNYESDTARGRLNRFIQDRVADGTYARHLGLIATIRRDFAQLAQIMNEGCLDSLISKELNTASEAYKQRLDKLMTDNPGILTPDEMAELRREVPRDELRHFERIVLYVDDLDRCPPEKVAEVLQAIHMLLFFPLFVVVVAVDARWVTRSLEKEFPHLLTLDRRADDISAKDPQPLRGGKEGLHATAFDYLEKIFQIPFWVRSMTDDSSKAFVAGLTQGWITKPSDPPLPPPQPEITADVATAVDHMDFERPADDLAYADLVSGITPAAPPLEKMEPSGTGRSAEEIQGKAPEIFDNMTLTQAEADLLKRHARFLGGSPRRAKRFVNLYLLIKTSLATGLPNLTPDVPTINDRALVALLTLVTGAPHVCQAFFAALPDSDATLCNIQTLYDNLAFNPAGTRPREEQAVREIVKSLLENDGVNGREMVEALHAFAPTAQRYSFQGTVAPRCGTA